MSQKFAVVRRGYDPVEVDSYIHELETIVSQRNQELTDYREKEAAINASVIEAKQLADKITKDAEAQADETRKKAEEDAVKMHTDAVANMQDIRDKACAMRDKLEQFKNAYNQILQQYLLMARSKDMTALFDDLEAFMGTLGLNKDEEAVSVDDLSVHQNTEQSS